jgi:branched-chain amino acid transport system permease protein
MTINSASSAKDRGSKAVRDSVFTGLMAFGLFFLLIGFKTDQNIRNELILPHRPLLFGAFVVAALIGRFLIDTVVRPYFAKTVSVVGLETKSENVSRKTFSYLPILLGFSIYFLALISNLFLQRDALASSGSGFAEIWNIGHSGALDSLVVPAGMFSVAILVVALLDHFLMEPIAKPFFTRRAANRALQVVSKSAPVPKVVYRASQYGLLLYPALLVWNLFLQRDKVAASGDTLYNILRIGHSGPLDLFVGPAGLLAFSILVLALIRVVLQLLGGGEAAPAGGFWAHIFRWKLRDLGLIALAIYPPYILYSLGLSGALKWVDNFGIQILIYVMLAWGLNVVVGLAGLLDLGYVAFYAIGAYSYALLSSQFGLSFWILLPLAGILAALWGVVLGFPVLRLRGDYLAIVTLAFGEIIRLVLINWTAVTKGTFGVSGIAKATFFGIYEFNATKEGFAATFALSPSSAYYKIFLYYLILLLCLLTAFVTIRLRRMPIGRAWEALREDEIACKSLGINTTTTKLTAFATGAMFGGFAGAFFAVRQGFVSPESFVFLESAIILAIVVLGGMGSLVGIAVAAVVMIGGTEILRELPTLLEKIHSLLVYFGAGDAVAGSFIDPAGAGKFDPGLYRMLLFGLAMVVVMLYKPRGFVGSREPTAFLHERKMVSGEFTKEGHG